MSNIHNFANRHLCEYASIFPTIAALLDHHLFVVGNGYDVDAETGMIVDATGKRIDEYPKMTAKKWEKLIAECHEKERGFAIRFGLGEQVDEKRLAQACTKYYPRQVDDRHFTEEALYREICNEDARRKSKPWGDRHYRPYPLCNYSKIFHLSEKTPAWFMQIAINFCNAWIRFLTEAIDKGDVWLAKEGQEKSVDYADAMFTIRHRDMLVARVAELKELMVKSFIPGTTVKIVKRDPLWEGAACSAEPMPGLKGKIVEFREFWKHPSNAGKVAIEFDPRHLGYEDDGENDPVTLFVRAETVATV